jgi:2',3'-cyclic-nucleotide 2'-phosphodiesterase/3'-nucleotidase
LGITSALPHQTGQWISHALEPQVHFSPALEQLGSVVQDLKDQGADLILLLAHSGVEIGPHDQENFACAAATVPGVDIMVMGHSHRLFPNADEARNAQVDPREGRIHGIPCVQPGFGGNGLGQIDLELSYDGHWQLSHAAPRLLFPENTSPDPKILACIAPAQARLAAEAHEIIGQASKPMHSYFAMLQPNPALGLIAESMIDGLDELDVQDAFAKLPRLAAVAPTLCGGISGPEHYLDISAGPVPATALDLLCPYEDRLTAKVMRGMDLREHLERAAAIYLAPTAFSEDSDILDPDMPGFCFDTIWGFGVTFELSRPPRYDRAGALIDKNAFRVTRMDFDGLPVGDDDLFLLALTSYRAGGGAAYPDLGRVLTQDRPRPMLRDLVRTRLGKDKPVRSPDWDLKGNPGQRISYMTSPHARAYLHELSQFDPADLGMTPEGFLHLRLTL